MKYAIYRLYKIKIALKKYCSINVKLFHSIFNYAKLYIMIYFLKYLQDIRNIIYNHIVYGKIIYKYLIKVYDG